MQLSFDFEELFAGISDVASVVEDSMLEKIRRNLIIKVADTVSLVGINPFITLRYHVPTDKVKVEGFDTTEGPQYIQLSCKDLLSYLSTFRNIPGIIANTVDLTYDKGKLKCTVVENDTIAGTTTEGCYYLDTTKVAPSILRNIEKEKPEEELQPIDLPLLKTYTKDLLPMMDVEGNTYSRLVFGKDYVVAFCRAHTTFIKNTLGEPLVNIKIHQRGVAFLDKNICLEEQASMCKKDLQLYIQAGKKEVFIRYEENLPDYSRYINLYSEGHNIELDRGAFDKALKRVLLQRDEAVTVRVSEEETMLYFRNSKLQQEIPVLSSNDLSIIKGKIARITPEVMAKAILHRTYEKDNFLNIYIVPVIDETVLFCFGDVTRNWFSAINVKLSVNQ